MYEFCKEQSDNDEDYESYIDKLVDERYYKDNKIYQRDKDDIIKEKENVNANRHFSLMFLKKHSSHNSIRLSSAKEQSQLERAKLKQEEKENNKPNIETQKLLSFCYLCSLHTHVHDQCPKVKPRPRPHSAVSSSKNDLIKLLESEYQTKNLTEYEFKIATGPHKHAGINTKVWFTIRASDGYWAKTELKDMDLLKVVNFTSGSTVKLNLMGPKIGDFYKMKLWHNSNLITNGWYLEYIEVTRLKDKKIWRFECFSWISKHFGPHGNSVLLNAIDFRSPHAYEHEQEFPYSTTYSNYIFKVKTGDEKNAGTDCQIWFDLRGSHGYWRKKELNNPKSKAPVKFTSGSEQTIKFYGSYLGNLNKLKIWFDKRVSTDNWFLEYVEITCLLSKTVWLFQCNQWLSNFQISDTRYCVTLEGDVGKFNRKIVKTGEMNYFLKIFTGKDAFSGTDANIFFELIGTTGKTSTQRITDYTKEKFERGSIDEYQFRDVDIGDLKQLIIWHDNTKFAPDWFLEKVIVRCEKILMDSQDGRRRSDRYRREIEDEESLSTDPRKLILKRPSSSSPLHSRSPTPIIKSQQSPRGSDKQVTFDKTRNRTRVISESEHSGASDSEGRPPVPRPRTILTDNYQYVFECKKWLKNSKKSIFLLTHKLRV